MVEAEEDDAFRVLENIERLSLEANAKIDRLPTKPGPTLDAITRGSERTFREGHNEVIAHIAALRGDLNALREATTPRRGKTALAVLTGAVLGAGGAIGALTVFPPAFLVSDMTVAKCADLAGSMGTSGGQPVCIFDVIEDRSR